MAPRRQVSAAFSAGKHALHVLSQGLSKRFRKKQNINLHPLHVSANTLRQGGCVFEYSGAGCVRESDPMLAHIGDSELPSSSVFSIRARTRIGGNYCNLEYTYQSIQAMASA
jgi:hypothetical protein